MKEITRFRLIPKVTSSGNEALVLIRTMSYGEEYKPNYEHIVGEFVHREIAYRCVEILNSAEKAMEEASG